MTQMTADATQKKRRSSRKNTITVRWLISNLGVVFLVLLIVELSVIYTLQHYYYNSAEQYLTTKISSVTTVLTRYSQDTGSNFSADLRSTFENFSDKERMELMAINSKGRVTLTTSGFAPDTGTAMPDYETAMESETGTWTGRQNGCYGYIRFESYVLLFCQSIYFLEVTLFAKASSFGTVFQNILCYPWRKSQVKKSNRVCRIRIERSEYYFSFFILVFFRTYFFLLLFFF